MAYSKFKNKKTALGGLVFDSKKEAARWAELQMLQKTGKIADLRRQVSIPLIPAGDGERECVYVADFTYYAGDVFVIEDCKSDVTRKLPAYIIKRKLVKALYDERTMAADFAGRRLSEYSDLRSKNVVFNEFC